MVLSSGVSVTEGSVITTADLHSVRKFRWHSASQDESRAGVGLSGLDSDCTIVGEAPP